MNSSGLRAAVNSVGLNNDDFELLVFKCVYTYIHIYTYIYIHTYIYICCLLISIYMHVFRYVDLHAYRSMYTGRQYVCVNIGIRHSVLEFVVFGTFFLYVPGEPRPKNCLGG